MNYLVTLLTGRQPLWLTFWLVGIPVFIAWDISSGCMLGGVCTLPMPMSDLILAAFGMITSLVLPFASFAIWRSATRYSGPRLWKIGAKAWALMWGICSFVFLLATTYGLFHYAVTGHP